MRINWNHIQSAVTLINTNLNDLFCWQKT